MPFAAGPATSRPSYAVSGWLEAAAFVIAIGALGLTYSIGHTLAAHPVAFVLYAMLASGIATLAITGFGSDVLRIMLHPMSWVVGIAIVLIEVFYYMTLAYVPPAHGNLILRIAIPLAMVSGWALLGRNQPVLAIAGAMMIVVAMAFIVAASPPEIRGPMTVSGVLAGIFTVVRGFASEFHPWNRTAHSSREKLRISGIVVFVASVLSLALAALVATAMAVGVVPESRFVPSVSEMLHLPTILLGCLVGGAILTLMAYLNFSSVVKITTENFTAMMAFSPLTSWAFQELGVSCGLIEADRPEQRLVAAMFAVVASVLLIFWAGRRARFNKPGAHA